MIHHPTSIVSHFTRFSFSEKLNKSVHCTFVTKNEFNFKDQILHEMEMENTPDNLPLSVLQWTLLRRLRLRYLDAAGLLVRGPVHCRARPSICVPRHCPHGWYHWLSSLEIIKTFLPVFCCIHRILDWSSLLLGIQKYLSSIEWVHQKTVK